MNTVEHGIVLRVFFSGRDARDWLEDCTCEFAWIFQERLRVERVFPKLLSTLPPALRPVGVESVADSGGWGRASKSTTELGSFAGGRMGPNVLPPGLNEMYSRLPCTGQGGVYQQTRWKMKMGVQLSIHIVHTVHLRGPQGSSHMPNPFLRCLYLSLLWDHPLSGIFKKSDTSHQPFISPEKSYSVGHMVDMSIHIERVCRCLFELMLPCF